MIHQVIQGFQTVASFNKISHEQQRLADAVDAQVEAKTFWMRMEAYVSAVAKALVPCTFFLLSSLIARESTPDRRVQAILYSSFNTGTFWSS